MKRTERFLAVVAKQRDIFFTVGPTLNLAELQFLLSDLVNLVITQLRCAHIPSFFDSQLAFLLLSYLALSVGGLMGTHVGFAFSSLIITWEL